MTRSSVIESIFEDETPTKIVDMSKFSQNDLMFVEYHYTDPVSEVESRGRYHLATVRDERVLTSCSIQSIRVPDKIGKLEPVGIQICQMCASRATEFSKKFFNGRKLKFSKPKSKEYMDAHDSDEEAYKTHRMNSRVPFHSKIEQERIKEEAEYRKSREKERIKAIEGSVSGDEVPF